MCPDVKSVLPPPPHTHNTHTHTRTHAQTHHHHHRHEHQQPPSSQQSETTSSRVVLLESYRDQAALASHGGTPHVDTWRTSATAMSSRTKAMWRAVGVDTPGRLIPDDAGPGVCVVTLVDVEVRAEEIDSMREAAQALATTLSTVEGVRSRLLQVRPLCLYSLLRDTRLSCASVTTNHQSPPLLTFITHCSSAQSPHHPPDLTTIPACCFFPHFTSAADGRF
jgi:hypothetical protein